MFNVIAQAPCSEFQNNVYKYDPFYQVGTNRGVIKRFHIHQVLTKPNVLFGINNFQSYPLKVSMFHRMPTASKFVPKNLPDLWVYRQSLRLVGYGGLEGFMLTEMAKYFNFTPLVSSPPDGKRYGNILENGSSTGSLGLVITRNVSIAMNGYFIKDYETEMIEFTVPFNNDNVCVVVPKAERIPQWLSIFRCFSVTVWYFVGATLVTLTFLWLLIAKCEGSNTQFACLDMFLILVSAPLKICFKKQHRVFLFSCLIFNLVITNIFQGTLVIYSTVSYFRDIDSLEDLDNSGLKILTTLNIFDYADSEGLNRLRRKILYSGGSNINRTAFKRDVSVIERKQDAKFLMNTVFLGHDGRPLLHITSFCPITYSVAFIVPKGSPFLDVFNRVIVKFVEGGFTNKWYNDMAYTVALEKMMSIGQEIKQKSFSAEDMKVVFYMWAIGMSLSTLSFVAELLWYKLTEK